MRYFKEKEFVCRCCGELPPFARANLEALVSEVLDPVREVYGKPIVVNSGYRCPKHNKEVGGAVQSQHMKGEAADISPVHGEGFTVHGSSSSRIIEFENDLQRLKQIIIANGKFDQLILYPTFIHVSWNRDGQNRKQILKKVGAGYQRVSSKELCESQGTMNHRGQAPGSAQVMYQWDSPRDSVPMIHGKEVLV